MNGELEELVVSGKDLDRGLVASMLSPYLRLDRDECAIRPLASWSNLQANSKILLYLLARKAMVALDFPLDIEGATTTEVINDTGIKGGTVKPTLRRLLGDNIIAQSKDRRYFVPSYAIERIRSILSKD